jgi:hypothetical protein
MKGGREGEGEGGEGEKERGRKRGAKKEANEEKRGKGTILFAYLKKKYYLCTRFTNVCNIQLKTYFLLSYFRRCAGTHVAGWVRIPWQVSSWEL